MCEGEEGVRGGCVKVKRECEKGGCVRVKREWVLTKQLNVNFF